MRKFAREILQPILYKIRGFFGSALNWRMATVASILVLGTAATIGSLVLFNDSSYADNTTGTVYFNRSRPYLWNAYGDSGWIVQVDIKINGETRTVTAYADCQNAGAAYPMTKTYYNVDFTYGNPDSSGNAEFTGYIWGTGGQGLKVHFETPVEKPYQPVTKSQAKTTLSIGEPLVDNLTVYEADQNGNQVSSNFQWRKSGGNYISASICVDVYGPFVDEQDRFPIWANEDKYFGESRYTPPSTLDSSQVTIIGDGIIQAATSAIRAELPNANILAAANRGFYTAIPGGSGDSGMDVISNNPMTNYVIYALGSDDLKYSTNRIDDIVDNDRFNEVRSAIIAKNANAKVIFVTIYNGDTVSFPLNAKIPDNLIGLDNINSYVKKFNRRISDYVHGPRGEIGTPDYDPGSTYYKSDVRAYDWYSEVARQDDTLPDMVRPDKITPSSPTGVDTYAASILGVLNNLQSGGAYEYGGMARWGLTDNKSPAGDWRVEANGKFGGWQCYNTGSQATNPGTKPAWERELTFNQLTGNPNGIVNSNNFPAGKYYFVTHISKGSNPEVLFDNWYSPFAEPTETAVVQFQPYVTSAVSSQHVDINNNEGIVDVITSHVADKDGKSMDDEYWQNIPVKVCVAMYGPYQSAQLESNAPTYNANDAVNNVCEDFSSAGRNKNFDFGTTDKNDNPYQPGYYYFVSRILKSDQTTDVSSLIINNWYSKFNPINEDEEAVVKFQPFVKSNVEDTTHYLVPDANNSQFIDKVTSYAATSSDNANSGTASNTSWLNNAKVKVCAKAWGPYQQIQANGGQTDNNTGGIPAPVNLKATICSDGFADGTGGAVSDTLNGTYNNSNHNYNGAGQDRYFKFNTDGWIPGHYYFTEHIVLSEQDQDTRNLISGSWNSKFNPSNEDEWGVMKFQPYFTSKVDGNQVFIDDINNANGNLKVVDTITSHAAKTIDNANSNTGNDTYWLDNDRDSGNGGIQVKVCVKAWGPYQKAQDYGSTPITNNAPEQTGYKAMVCSDNTSFGTGGSVSAPQGNACLGTNCNFTISGQDRTFTFETKDWNPGYYYFTEHVVYNDQLPATKNYTIGDWNSKFNPQTEDEATIEKFQIKPTSQTASPSGTTINTDIRGDSNHDGKVNGSDNELGTIPVLEPTDAYIEDSFNIRAYDTNDPNDTANTNTYKDGYWLKDRNDRFVTFHVCANIYGPYQQPQGDGNTNGSSARIPANNQIGQTANPVNDPNFPKNYYKNNDSRQQCFWTDTLQGKVNGDATLALGTDVVNGLVKKPTASGGPGTYTVRWSNQGTDGQGKDNYFQPGYYYVVWSVDAGSSQNNKDTQVDIGVGNTVDQKNGEFLESNWYSPFGEQTESFYSQFQPIAKSTIPETPNTNENDLLGNGCSIYYKDGKQYCYRNNGFYIDNGEKVAVNDPPICSDTVTNECVIKSTNDTLSDNTSRRKKSTDGDGIILECDENKYSNLVNYVDDPENYPKEKLHCHNVTDQIYLGAVNAKAIDGNTREVDSQDNNDYFWPKDKGGVWEPVKFQVKLYGPFKYPYARTPASDDKAGWAGSEAVTTVPKIVGAHNEGVEGAKYSQPIAESCVISTSTTGPNWNDAEKGIYDAVFTQDISTCAGSGFPSDTEIELTPGFYVSVVEIVRDDIENTNAEFILPECKSTINNSKTQCATQWNTRPHNMVIKDRFTSAWGDKKETLLVPIPLHIVTRRDNSAEDTFTDQVTINDQYWVAGFSGEYVDDDGKKQHWTDIWGDEIPAYNDANPGYNGGEGYVADTNVPPNTYKYSYSSSGVDGYYSSDAPGYINVRLYGAYPLEDGRPNENNEYCVANKLVKYGTWQLPAKDTGLGGADLPYPAPLTLYEKGWYVFQYTYTGGDRITNIKTQCGDTNEMFRIVKNEIGLVTAAYADQPTAPTRITDTVQVTGSFQESDKGSVVKLSLYKRAGEINSPGVDKMDGGPVCWLYFTVDSDGTYTTEDYIDEKGYILADEYGEGRCYTETGGHYYWIEEFLRPGSNPLDPVDSDYIQPIGTGLSPEDIDIKPPPTPEVTTDADPTTSVNRPFHDTALVTNIPDDNTKVYKLWFTAYGPFADGTVNCSSQLIYSNQSSPIDVTKNGRYDSEYISVSTNGIVYWVEHLEDEDGNIVDQGECGTRRENTYVVGPDVPPVTPFEPFEPLYPDAGYISRQVGKVIALGFMSMLGAWQLTDKNSWLLRKRNSR
jgi:hypothetical protein